MTGVLRLETEIGPLAVVGYSYDAVLRLVLGTVGNAAFETFGYDAIGRLATHGASLAIFS